MSESFVVTHDNCEFVYSGSAGSAPLRKQGLDIFGPNAYMRGVGDVLYTVEKWFLSPVLFDTAMLISFVKTAQVGEAVEVQEPAASHSATVTPYVERTEAAEALITSHGLTSAAIAVEVALHESFEDVSQARIDYDPGDEEEDDHPWLRVYVQTSMSAAATLRARRQFYKLLNANAPRDQAAYFHLAFRLIP